MANLLTDKPARAMRAEFRARFVLVTALALLSTALIAALLLLPSYMVLSVAESGERTAVEKARENKQDMQDITRAQGLLKDVNVVLSATSSPSVAISRAVALKPKGIVIDHISYDVGKPLSQLLVTGKGSTRDVIDEYRDALLSDQKFPSVSIPVSALVDSSSDGSFTATIKSGY